MLTSNDKTVLLLALEELHYLTRRWHMRGVKRGFRSPGSVWFGSSLSMPELQASQ